MQLAGIGKVVFWEGGSLWLALITGTNTLHLHHAAQISLPLSGEVMFRQSAGEDFIPYPGAIIAPDTPHAFAAPGRVLAHILFEPESAAGRALRDRYGDHGISALPEPLVERLVAPLRAAYAANADDAELVRLAREVIAELSGVETRGMAVDPRVARVIDYVRTHLDEPITLEALAGVAGLSPSRLRHLFVEETGIAAKSFILWERINRALALGFSGTPWTEAAYATNFADSAHLTRTCRRMFGLVPTAARIGNPHAASSDA